MYKSIRLVAVTTALIAFSGASWANMENQTPKIAETVKPVVASTQVPCVGKEVKDANGRIIIAGCAGIAMPCLNNADCCSNNCDNSACNE